MIYQNSLQSKYTYIDWEREQTWITFGFPILTAVIMYCSSFLIAWMRLWKRQTLQNYVVHWWPPLNDFSNLLVQVLDLILCPQGDHLYLNFWLANNERFWKTFQKKEFPGKNMTFQWRCHLYQMQIILCWLMLYKKYIILKYTCSQCIRCLPLQQTCCNFLSFLQGTGPSTHTSWTQFLTMSQNSVTQL